MADLERISRDTDTSLVIVRAIADQRGDDGDRIREALGGCLYNSASHASR